MLRALVTGEIGMPEAAVVLADLHHRLHEIPARVSSDPGTRIVHLDLHPDNVLLGPRGPVVIDWTNAAEGPADLDIAMSAVILAQAAVQGGQPVQTAGVRAFLTTFLRSAGGDPLSVLDQAVALRSSDPTQSDAEIDCLGAVAVLIAESR